VTVDALTHAVLDPVLDGTVKGWPDLGCRASEVPARGLSIDDLPTPVLAIREAALRHNIDALAGWCTRQGVLLAPHAKTTMAPRLLERQLAAGAWGLTVADVRQARVALVSGAKHVLIANEIASPADLDWVCEQTADVVFCVDSAELLELAEARHRHAGGPPLSVLVELGFGEGRCGLRSPREVRELARAVAASPHLRLRGIEGYEGLIGEVPSIDVFLEQLVEACAAVATLLDEPQPLVTTGGSAYIDRVVDVVGTGAAELGWTLCLRSGCYVTHDHGIYERNAAHRRDPAAPRFEPAIEVRASVLSRPQRDRLILGCGRRDVSFDAGLPILLDHPHAELVALNDQHAHVRVAAASPLRPGDVVRLGISHPCTALDRWRVIPLIDDTGRVLEAIRTWF
jgi:D-serine deaminase-like pyridoxal phosphate-dependent protein